MLDSVLQSWLLADGGNAEVTCVASLTVSAQKRLLSYIINAFIPTSFSFASALRGVQEIDAARSLSLKRSEYTIALSSCFIPPNSLVALAALADAITVLSVTDYRGFQNVFLGFQMGRRTTATACLITILFTMSYALPAADDSDTTEISCVTTAGTFEIRLIHVLHPHKSQSDSSLYSYDNVILLPAQSWSPLGVARFIELVEAKFFDDQIFYRVIPGFLTQFGVASKPEIQVTRIRL